MPQQARKINNDAQLHLILFNKLIWLDTDLCCEWNQQKEPRETELCNAARWRECGL